MDQSIAGQNASALQCAHIFSCYRNGKKVLTPMFQAHFLYFHADYARALEKKEVL